jgi:hypothetical protein
MPDWYNPVSEYSMDNLSMVLAAENDAVDGVWKLPTRFIDEKVKQSAMNFTIQIVRLCPEAGVRRGRMAHRRRGVEILHDWSR